jgi:hypothetical protein
MKYIIGVLSPNGGRSPKGVGYTVRSEEFKKSDFDRLSNATPESFGEIWSLLQFKDEIQVLSDFDGLEAITRKHIGLEIREEGLEDPRTEEFESYYFMKCPHSRTIHQAVNFGEHLEEVKRALRSMSDYLRGINDPDILTSELITTRSYIDASLCFFDENKYPTGVPNEVPAELAQGVKEQLEKTDWTKASSEARGWVKVIVDAISAYFKFSAGS